MKISKEEKQRAIQAFMNNKEEKNNNDNSGKKTFFKSDANWTATDENKDCMLTFLGFPFTATSPELRKKKTPFDPTLVNRSWILSDSGKLMRIIVPPKQSIDGSSKHWFWRLYYYAMKGEKDGQDYVHYNKDREWFNRVATNNGKTYGSPKYNKGWYSQSDIMWNVIDWNDKDFHRETMQSKGLANNTYMDKDKNVRYSEGINFTLDKLLMKNIIVYASNKDLDELPVYVKKIKNSEGKFDFLVQNAFSDPAKCLFSGCFDEESNIAKVNSIVDKSLFDLVPDMKLINWDKAFPIVTYQYLNWLVGKYVKTIDDDTGSKFHEELQDLVEEEKKNPPEKYESVYENPNGTADKVVETETLHSEPVNPVNEIPVEKKSQDDQVVPF